MKAQGRRSDEMSDVIEVAEMGERYPPMTVYGIINNYSPKAK